MRAQGIDFSVYQEGYDPTVKKHDFAMIRGTTGLEVDGKFSQHAESIQPVPVRMVYHYFKTIGISDPKFWLRQADFFLETVTPWDFDCFVLDFEKTGNSPSMRFGAGAYSFLKYVQDNTRRWSLLYTNPDVYQAWLIQYGQKWMNEFPFICAQYPFDRKWDDQLNFCYSGEWWPRLPAGRMGWDFWQFSADGNQKGPENGIKRMPWNLVPPAVDLLVFNGTVTQLTNWLRSAPGGILPPIEEPTPEEYQRGWNDALDQAKEALEPFYIKE